MAATDVLTGGPLGTLVRRVFGTFTEHLGRFIYGGVFDQGVRCPGPKASAPACWPRPGARP